ncbi:MAG: heavy metal translocating P-type ATPase [Lachnospiraceae bacterium]|nr:heavy metal translocating P-type ATPase [Lachnospiraceae bacterium]
MDQYTVTGMSCAACQARVEKAVSKVPGVTACSVSLLTNSMGVEGEASPGDIIKAVEDAGYGAKPKGEEKSTGDYSAKLAAEEDALKDRETPVLKKRLITSLGFLLILMYFSMGHMMWGWPLPAFFHGSHVAMGLIQLVLAAIVMVINQKFFVSGFKSLAHGAPNMDTLIALGSSAAFIYSTIMLFAMTRAQVDGNMALVEQYMMEFYFESAAMILTLITIGKMLEAHSKGKTTNALKSLMKLAPKTANVIRGGAEVTVDIDQVRRGDVFVVRPGENIPVDGIVLEGTSAVNEAALTGESLPVDKQPGSEVSSATLNQSGFIKCEATRVGEDTSLAQIISMVSDAAATKAPVAKLADTISGIFVPVVIAIAVVTTLIWLAVGQTVGFALARGICVLVVSCPCALGLATPVAIMVGNGVGAKNGILFKNAEALQEAGNVQIVALDKTGTITSGEPRVVDIIPARGVSESDLLTRAVALEKKSEHPLARAILAYADENGMTAPEVSEFAALPGNGLTAVLSGDWLKSVSHGNGHGGIKPGLKADGGQNERLYGGNLRFITKKTHVPSDMRQEAERLSALGKTPLFFASDKKLLGIIAVADTIKEDSAQAVRELQNMGIHVVMLTGDNQRTAEAIGKEAGVDEVIAGVLPDGKEAVIRELQEKGRGKRQRTLADVILRREAPDHYKVAMVGDGINDAPALTRADTGIAIGAGTDVAIDAADVVLMKSRLTDVTAAIRLSRNTYKNILENLFWALFYNSLLIPVAAGAYAHAFGITMDPMFGAAAMSLSSFCVVSNALRLNLMKIHDTVHDKKLKFRVETDENGKLLADKYNTAEDSGEGENNMAKTLKIEGMMCPHCEATVKKALEKIDGVASAEVSHEAGTAVVELTADVDDAVLTQAVEDKDYKVLGIE